MTMVNDKDIVYFVDGFQGVYLKDCVLGDGSIYDIVVCRDGSVMLADCIDWVFDVMATVTPESEKEYALTDNQKALIKKYINSRSCINWTRIIFWSLYFVAIITVIVSLVRG